MDTFRGINVLRVQTACPPSAPPSLFGSTVVMSSLRKCLIKLVGEGSQAEGVKLWDGR